ncbi:RNA-binding protein BRN1-like isoform X2 [Wolffia australiana]
MAEAANGLAARSGDDGGGAEDGVKLFVGQVPKSMTEAELLAMFQEVALVDEVNIIKDKVTKASRGCCFVICPSRLEADKAIDACHNKKTLPGASSPLQVKYADGELERLECKLFIGMLPKNVTEAEVSALFSKYGKIKEMQILRGSQQTSKGCAFIKYDTKDQAIAALEALNGKHKMEGSNVPLVVKWADSEKERQARRAQRAQSHAPHVPNSASARQPSLFGALPMSYIPSYNGMGYQTPGTYGIVPYSLPPVQNQASYPSLTSPGSQRSSINAVNNPISPGMAPRHYAAMQSATFMGATYPSVPGMQYPMAYNGSMMNHGSLAHPQGTLQPTILSSDASVYPSIGVGYGDNIEGPPGANLFIYHIPQEFGDQELFNAFQAFGRVLSSKVFVDKATGLSKCFGFVSYDSPAAAQTAISMMNGCQLGGKKLKVQLKRENKLKKPY